MKAVLSAFIGSDNLGDEALNELLIKWLAPALELMVLTKNVERTKQLGAPHAVRFTVKNFVREIRQADMLILGGGGIINDESSMLSLVKYVGQMFVAWFLGKKVYWLFVGAGPVRTVLGRALLRTSRWFTAGALVRDEESAALLRGFKNVTVAYDLAFNYPAPHKTKRSNEVLFAPRDWFFLSSWVPTRRALKRALADPQSRLQTYRLHLVKYCVKCLQDNPKITLRGLAFYYSQDLDLLYHIQRSLPENLVTRFVVEEHELTPARYAQLAASAQAVIGVRLHSLILGAAAGAPIVPLTYSSKVANLVNYLGIGATTTVLDKPDFDVDAAAARFSGATAISQDLLHKITIRNNTAFSAFIADVLK